MVVYRCIPRADHDDQLAEEHIVVHNALLNVGGLYLLQLSKLYRVVGTVGEGVSESGKQRTAGSRRHRFRLER